MFCEIKMRRHSNIAKDNSASGDNWTEEGIKLTWTVEHPGTWAPKIYGGYIPKDMDPRVAQALREAHSHFYELAP